MIFLCRSYLEKIRNWEGMNMPTSTFGKQFEVRHEKAADFVREMSKSVAPTLRQDFHSNMVFLHQNTRLKESLIRALNVR